MKRFGIGLLGCGRISERHLGAYRDPRALDGLGEVVALCDADPAALERQGTAHDVQTRYSRLDDLIADQRVDVVVVLTPPEVRREVVLPLVRAGKHLLVEKPFAHSLSEARAMVDAAAAAGVTLAVNQNYRWRSDTVKLKELIDRGTIGEVLGMHQLFAGWRDEAEGWRSTTRYLALAVMAVHWFDRFRWLTGDEAESVYCAARSSGLLHSTGEDWAAATVRLQRGALAHLTEDWISASRHADDVFMVDGTDGTLVVDDRGVAHYRRAAGEAAIHPIEQNFATTFATSMRVLLEALARGGEPSISGRDNLGTIGLLDGAYRSAERGEVVHLGTPVAAG